MAATMLPPSPMAAAAAPLTVDRSSGTEVVLAWQAPPLVLTPVMAGGTQYSAPRMVGLSTLAAPGEPQLPAASLLLALPPGATAVATILTAITMTVPLPAPVLLAPVADASVDPRDPLPQPAPLILPTNYGQRPAELTPAAVVTISPPQQWRSQQVVRVRVNPVQVDTAQKNLVVYQVLRVAVHFAGGERGTSVQADRAESFAEGPFAEGPFEPLLAAAIANYPEARTWRRAPALPATRRAAPPDGPWLRITTDRRGLHRIDCTLLATAGVELAMLDPATIRLYRDGPGQTEVAFLPAMADGHCDAAGSFLFYAEAVDTVYTGQAVYWLTYGGAPGQRMNVRPASAGGNPVESYLHTARYEVNRLYYSYIPLAENAHHWYWDILAAPTGVSRTYSFTVAALAQGNAQLTLDLAGYDGAHHTHIALNGRAVADLTWSGRTARHFDLPLDPVLVAPGDNHVTVTAAGGAGDYQYMDGFTITTAQPLVASGDRLEFTHPVADPARYRVTGFSSADLLVFDLSDPMHPQQISGATLTGGSCPCTLDFGAAGPASYLVTSRAALHTPLSVVRAQPFTLHDPHNQADYLVIAPAPFHTTLLPLLAQRAAQGLRTQLVDLQSIYDEFGGGETDPFALRAFLAHTLATWQAPAPTYVLLVGDGTRDPRGYVDAPPANMLPAFLRTVDPRLGETASDNQYGTLDTGDNLPQFAIGRWPVATTAEVAALVAKTLRYERSAAPGAWRQRLAVVADNAFAAGGLPDSAGNFWALGDQLADNPALAEAGYTVDRLYFNPCAPADNPACALADPPYPPFTTADALATALNAVLTTGRQLLIYIGHGSPVAWAGHPSLFTVEQATALANADRPAMVLELTCYTGYFHLPHQAVLAEGLLAAPGGAMVTWASSGVSGASGHDALAQGFLAAVAAPATRAAPATQAASAPLPVGLAAVAGKMKLWVEGDGAHRENLDTFHLFGDPALRLVQADAAPAMNELYLPWIGANDERR